MHVENSEMYGVWLAKKLVTERSKRPRRLINFRQRRRETLY